VSHRKKRVLCYDRTDIDFSQSGLLRNDLPLFVFDWCFDGNETKVFPQETLDKFHQQIHVLINQIDVCVGVGRWSLMCLYTAAHLHEVYSYILIVFRRKINPIYLPVYLYFAVY